MDNRLISFGILGVLVVFAVLVIAQPALPPGFISAQEYSPITNCYESDGGLDIYSSGSNQIGYLNNNGTVANLSVNDYCLSNTVVVEGLCGSWINSNFNTTAYGKSIFAGQFDCTASNTTSSYTCLNGACVAGGTNVSNGPDLIINNIGFTFLQNGTIVQNGTNVSTYTVTALVDVKNAGNQVAGASLTRVGFRMISGPLATSSWAYLDIPTPAMSRGAIWNVNTTFAGYDGNFQMESSADFYHAVIESEENNNYLAIGNSIP
jgi:hypothetical protein